MNINWEVSFEEFNESKICGNIKGKREICFEPKMEKIFPWKYSDQFSYFDHILLLWCWIDLILAATERELEDLNVCSLQNFKICLIQGEKWPGSWFIVGKGNWHFIFSFLGSMCFGVLNVENIEVIQGQPHFFGCWKTLFLINF